MKQIRFLLVAFITILIISCDNSTNDASKKDSAYGAGKSDAKEKSTDDLVTNATAPTGETFKRITAGGASFELPTGNGWVQEDNSFHNAALDMTIVVQSQTENMIGVEKDYLNSYNDNNIRDAENWKRGPEEIGKIKSVEVARLTGNFNNGQPYVTRDYVYFDKAKTVILQVRINEKNKDKLQPMADYIATTYQ